MTKPQILVTYASRYGSTAEVAESIAETLKTAKASVTLQPIADVESVEDFDMVILGSPVYSGDWLPDAVDFVKNFQHDLKGTPVALFAVCMRMRNDTPEMRASVMGVISHYKTLLQPVSVGLFAGALDYEKLSPIARLQIETKGLPEGDFREWDKVKTWANDLMASGHTGSNR